MKISIHDDKTKEILTEIMIDILKNRKDLFYDIVIEAIEEIGLANAIQEGRQDEFVEEEMIFSLLDGQDE